MLMLIAFCAGLVMVLVLGGVFVLVNKKYRQSVIEQKKSHEKFLAAQDERLASCIGKVNKIKFDIETDNRQWLEDEKREFFTQLNYMTESLSEVTENMTNEIREINTRIDREVELLNQEKANQTAFLEEYSKDCQNFRDDVIKQMEIVSEKSQPLSKQLDNIAMKLAEINELKQEIAEFTQPVQTDTIKKWHSDKAVYNQIS